MFNQSRSYIIRILFVIAFLVMIGQLFNLQVISSKYQQLAQENAVYKKIVYPSWGIVYDRKGKAIVNNEQMFDLLVTPSEVKNLDTAYLCRLLEIDTTEFKKRMIEAIVRNGRYRPSSFEGLLSPQKYARLQENMYRFEDKGFILQDRPVRIFPFDAGAHVMGYVGEADSGIIARSNEFYQPGDYVGRTGLEAYYEKVLMGQRGIQYLIKDHRNRLVGSFQRGELDEKPISGKGINTYIDIEVQQLAEKLLSNKIGAIVAIEPSTGGIIAMASGPTINPNSLTGASFKKTYSKAVLDVSRPLFNRAIKGQYPPGSTYKPIGALIALDLGLITPKSGIGCSGTYYGCNRPMNCTEKWGGHADNLREAIAHSCNSFFAMTYKLTVDNPKSGNTKNGYHRWREYMTAFGYGHTLGLDLPSEDKGLVPDTARYNRVYRGSWNSCTNVSLGIGQDMMLATPLQIANTMCIVANKGSYFTPHFVKSFEEGSGADTMLKPFKTKNVMPVQIGDSLYEYVINGMQDVTEIGTAKYIPKIPGINICAKTGTAENKIVLDGKALQLKDHSVFACFAPRENPKIAIAVIVENGGFGSTWAGPMAYLLIEKFLTDSLRGERKIEADRIAAANLMPFHLPRLQYKEDSIRARFYFNLTKDSSYIQKYLKKGTPGGGRTPARRDSSNAPRQQLVFIDPKNNLNKIKTGNRG